MFWERARLWSQPLTTEVPGLELRWVGRKYREYGGIWWREFYFEGISWGWPWLEEIGRVEVVGIVGRKLLEKIS